MAAATAEKEPEVKKPAFKNSDRVLVFCAVSPCMTLSVEKVRLTGMHDADGRSIKQGRNRQVMFQNHRAMIEMRDMNDKTIMVDDGNGGKEPYVVQVGVRNMEGYCRDFFEMVRTPGMDPKAESLQEILKRSPKQFEGIMARAKDKNLYANGEDKTDAYSVAGEMLKFEMEWKRTHPEA